MSATLDIARRYLAAGLSVIPIAPTGTKQPALSTWKPYQSRQPTEDEARRWFASGKDGIGIIGGRVSGNLEIIDVDDAAVMRPFVARILAHAPKLRRAPIVETPRGTCHVYARCNEPVAGNLKLAQRAGCEGEPKGVTMIETRGEGGYCVAPGSPPECHRLRREYRLLQGDLAAIPVLAPEERALVLSCARSFNRLEWRRDESPRGTAKPKGRFIGEPPGHRPGDVFNRNTTWSDVLVPHGWQTAGRSGEVIYWRRPGKTDRGISATTNYADADLFYVFSSNASPFEPGASYSKFAAYTLLNHGGNFAVAAKRLREVSA